MVQNEYNMADKRIKAFILLALIIGMMILVKHLMGQHFSSVEDLRQYMRGLGILAPVFLAVFQAFQVVVPVVPGYLGCAAGAVAFGTPIGFACNYIGITQSMMIVSPGPLSGIASSMPKHPAATRQKIMNTTVDVLMSCFFSPCSPTSTITLD